MILCTINVVWDGLVICDPCCGSGLSFLIVSCNLFSRLLCSSRFWSVCCVSWYVLNAGSECENDSQAYASLRSIVKIWLLWLVVIPNKVTLLCESMHEWYIGYERKNCHPPRDWAQLCNALLKRFGSNIQLQEAQSTLMSISQRQ